MAARAKLAAGDVSIVVAGSSTARYTALASGNVQGAMLSQPFDLEAEANGMHELAASSDTIAPWVFKTIDVNASWAAANRDTAVRVLRALQAAIRFGYAHRDAAVAVLMSETRASRAIAERTYDIDFGRWKAFDPTLTIDLAALQDVADAQAEFGALPAAPKAADLVDPSFAAALR